MITTGSPNSWVWAVGASFSRGDVVVGPGQERIGSEIDVASPNETYWLQRRLAVSPTPVPVPISAAQVGTGWEYLLVEVKAR